MHRHLAQPTIPTDELARHHALRCHTLTQATSPSSTRAPLVLLPSATLVLTSLLPPPSLPSCCSQPALSWHVASAAVRSSWPTDAAATVRSLPPVRRPTSQLVAQPSASAKQRQQQQWLVRLPAFGSCGSRGVPPPSRAPRAARVSRPSRAARAPRRRRRLPPPAAPGRSPSQPRTGLPLPPPSVRARAPLRSRLL